MGDKQVTTALIHTSSFHPTGSEVRLISLTGPWKIKMLNEQRIPNPVVTWEVANQSNIGFDGQLFEGKFNFSFDYFYNLRTNILWTRNASVPATTGLTLPRENIGKVANQGFEITLGTKNTIGDFMFGVSLNSSYNQNKIIFWDETPGSARLSAIYRSSDEFAV